MVKKKYKYAKLLLESVGLSDKDYLFIAIPSILSDFKNILEEAVNEYSNKKVFFFEIDSFKKRDLMLRLDQENIIKHPLFDQSIYNKYAKLDAAFLFIRSYIPGLMDEVNPKIIKETAEHERSTCKAFRDMYEGGNLNWCIAGVPNIYWAEDLGMNENELWDLIFKVSLIEDDNDPYLDWCNKIKKLDEIAHKLNAYQFSYLKYQNALGTDLKVYLPENHIWCSGKGVHGEICNLPTEEVFTSPFYKKTEGKVYASKPLLYNNILIEDFYFVFKEGKVVEYDAKKGKEILKTILETDEYSSYLGECALVSFDSPINNTGILFKETLYDENASCHLALGRGYNECIQGGENKRGGNLRSIGVNDAKTHVDFMIGTKDMEIIGVTKEGKTIQIMKNGNLQI